MTATDSTAPPIIIQGAEVLLPSGELARKEVAIANGKITAVGTGLEVPAGTRTVRGNGLTLLPGVIDPHIYIGSPGPTSLADLYSTTCACAKGGVTSFLAMPNPPAFTTTKTVLTDKLAIAAQQSIVNYGFFTEAYSHTSPDITGSAPGSIVFLGNGTSAGGPPTSALSERVLSEPALSAFIEGEGLMAIHPYSPCYTSKQTQTLLEEQIQASAAQHHSDKVALQTTQLALNLAKQYQRRVHILSVSTEEEAELLRRDKPSWVSAEVTPQHLLLDISASQYIGTFAKEDPSLQRPRDRVLLWQALLDGIIDFVATSHTPQTLASKAQNYADAPAGMPGVETTLPLMLTQAKQNRCTIAQVSHWLSSAVAHAYQIPNKGLIEPGYDADLVLVDLTTYRPVRREELQGHCGWSPFEGWNLTGWPVITMVGGQIVYERGELHTDVRGQALQFG